MNRSPRRPSRPRPPLRGRSAACSSSGYPCPPAPVRPRPPIGGAFPIQPPPKGIYDDIPPKLKKLFNCLLKLYRKCPWPFRILFYLLRW